MLEKNVNVNVNVNVIGGMRREIYGVFGGAICESWCD